MDYAEIIAYLEEIARQSRRLKATYVGDYDRIYDVINNPDQYQLPCLWIESPEMTPVGNEDASLDQWSISILVLDKGNPQNVTRNKYTIAQTYRVARMLLTKLTHDSEMGMIRFSLINKKMSQVDPYSSDWLLGWRIDIQISTTSQYGCYEASEWDQVSDPPLGTLSFAIMSNGGYSVERLQSDVLGWTYAWTFAIENGAVTTDPNAIPTGANCYATLTATHTSGATRVASAFIYSSDSEMISVPYLYNPYEIGN
jgi:hypothetical protein